MVILLTEINITVTNINLLVLRTYSVKTAKTESVSTTSCKLFGQPTHESHPHLLNQGEITPQISKEEFQNRREKLVENVLQYSEKNCAEKKHLVCTFRIIFMEKFQYPHL